MKPIVAIVGRPNVGKSMLFNKLIGKRLSIVEDTPGVTRDRIYGETDWNGRSFTLIDTGGIEPRTDDQILSFMRDQAQIAIENATVIIFLTDVRTGLTASDQEVANMLLRSRKPVVLAVNKADQVGRENPDVYEFYNLGLGDPIAVSAVHGHGTGDLLDACLQYFPPEDEEEEDSDVIQVAIIGKPNVGKSSLTNRILGQQRVIVSNVAGTTRDTVEEKVQVGHVLLRLCDTAGLRESDDPIERLGVERSRSAMEEAELILVLWDSSVPATEEDGALLRRAVELAPTILVNTKGDLPSAPVPFLNLDPMPPVVTLSSKTGQGLSELEGAVAALFPKPEDVPYGQLLTNQRQEEAAHRASQAVARAREALEAGVTPDALLTDVEQAMAALGELTGRTVREDITSRIFQRFCVGK